jgi:hypothetical protein
VSEAVREGHGGACTCATRALLKDGLDGERRVEARELHDGLRDVRRLRRVRLKQDHEARRVRCEQCRKVCDAVDGPEVARAARHLQRAHQRREPRVGEAQRPDVDAQLARHRREEGRRHDALERRNLDALLQVPHNVPHVLNKELRVADRARNGLV